MPIVKKKKKKSKQHKKRLEKLHQMRDNLKAGGEVSKTVAYKPHEVVERNSTAEANTTHESFKNTA